MNTYSFPLGNDHDDYDAIRVHADLRALSGPRPAARSHHTRRPHLAALLGLATGRSASHPRHAVH